MTELDERLAEALREAVPEPPRQLDPEAIRHRSAHSSRPTRWLAPALAAATVIAIAVGITVALTRDGEHRTAPGTGGDPRELVGVLWDGLVLDGDPTGGGLFLQIKPDGSYSQSVGCTGVDGDLSLTSNDLTIQSAHRFFANCNINPEQMQRELEVTQRIEQVFTGRFEWSLNSNQLTLHKDGEPAVIYTRWRPLGAHRSLNAVVVLDQTTAPANGEPLSGYLFLENNTLQPVVISNVCNGWYGVGLSNSRVQNFYPGFFQAACGSKLLPIGPSQIPIRISTTFAECVQPGGTAGGSPPVPKCIGPAHSESPPLPPGRYLTSVGFNELSVKPKQGPPITVTLTKP